MYTSVLRQATGNPEFTFNLSTVSFPPLDVLLERQKVSNSAIFCFGCCIAVSLISCVVIGFIVREGMDSLKHQ